MRGIFTDLTFEEYKACPGINQSGLKLFNRSPRHYFDAYLSPEKEPDQSTVSQRRGFLVHTIILEPELFDGRYISELNKADFPDAIVTVDDIKRELDHLGCAYRKTLSKSDLVAILVSHLPNANARVWDLIQSDYARRSSNKNILSLGDWNLCQRLRAAVQNHPVAQVLMESGKPEVSIFWDDVETGVQCKMRADWLTPDGILDWKTTEDASPEAFAKTIARFGYHVQAAFYLDGWAAATETVANPDAFIFGALETKRPHELAFYYADPEMIQEGRITYRHWLRKYAYCLTKNDWPGYAPEISRVSLPKWAMKGNLDVTSEF